MQYSYIVSHSAGTDVPSVTRLLPVWINWNWCICVSTRPSQSLPLLFVELAIRGSESRGSLNSTRSCTQVPQYCKGRKQRSPSRLATWTHRHSLLSCMFLYTLLTNFCLYAVCIFSHLFNSLGKTCWDTEVTVFLIGQKNHHCPICDKAFALDVYLKSHLKTHKKQDGYIQCPKCPRRFASEETLQVVQKFEEYEIQHTSLICAGA